jgi:hypothetical protein
MLHNFIACVFFWFNLVPMLLLYVYLGRRWINHKGVQILNIIDSASFPKRLHKIFTPTIVHESCSQQWPLNRGISVSVPFSEH